MIENVDLKVVTTDDEYNQAMAVRRAVFVGEQGISPEKEFDGNDHSATHLLAVCDGNPVGTMRIRYFNGFVKFERMCVLKNYRKTDLSERIMRKGMMFSAFKGYEKVYGVCKSELVARWRRDGFEPIEGAPTVNQNGMTLVPVLCPLPKIENSVSIRTPACVLNAKEGAWPLEQTDENHRAQKEKLRANLHKIRCRLHPKPSYDPRTISPDRLIYRPDLYIFDR